MAVTSTNNLRIGSSGEDVLELQKKLNQTNYGYNLDEDGSFGEKTLAAVKDYQQRSGLEVDGVVGTNTWGALTKANTPAATTPTTTPTTTQTTTQTTTSNDSGFSYKPYQKSDVVAQAEAMLQQQLSQKPGEYTSAWQTQLNDTLNKILNREKFSYDLNGDALYQQYKDQYATQGQLAMMDAMGQAAALNGGYGSSYAQSVGQQTYQGYLQQLNDKVPELYQLALDQYNREGDEMYNQASLMASMENQDYGRYRDSLSDYYTELDRLTEDARYQGEQDYSKWADNLSLQYGMYRDQVADKQWQAEFDEAKRQYDQAYALQNSSSSSSSNGGSTSGNGDKGKTGGNWDNGGYDTEIVKKAQAFVGASDDGYWGSDSAAKAKAKGYNSIAEVVAAMGGGGGGTGFTGTTYSEAVAFANSHGVPNAKSSSILTPSEWSRVKSSGSSRDGANEFDTYQEYLQYAVESMIDAYGK